MGSLEEAQAKVRTLERQLDLIAEDHAKVTSGLEKAFPDYFTPTKQKLNHVCRLILSPKLA